VTTAGTGRPPLGVILTGGLGTRLRPLTNELPKALVPILNRPLIAYGLDLLASAGLREVVVVVGGSDERTGPAALAAAPEGVSVSVSVQPEPKGSGDAVICAGPAIDGRPLVVLAVDALLLGDLREHVEAFAAADVAAWLVLHPTDRPQEMGIAILEGDRVVDFEEKPERPRSDLALVGVWMLAPATVERVRTNPLINRKGESDLSATLALMLEEGAAIGGRRFNGRWLDVGALGSLLDTQAALLATQGGGHGAGALVEDSQLQEPVLIGAGARVRGSRLGPNVVVGDGAVLEGVTLADAMISPQARLDGYEGKRVIVTPSGEIGEA
jgi:glucose-1-phosphate thymidylyltransferase